MPLCKTSLGYGTYNIILEDSITQPFTYDTCRTSFNAQREVSSYILFMPCRLDKLTHDPVDEQTVYEVSLFGAYKLCN